MTDTNTPTISDESERRLPVVVKQRAYSVPADVADELAALRAELESDRRVTKLRIGFAESLHEDLKLAEQRASAAEARVDVLMLEYCPEEMTPEQKERWAAHQRRVTPEQEARVTAALKEPK